MSNLLYTTMYLTLFSNVFCTNTNMYSIATFKNSSGLTVFERSSYVSESDDQLRTRRQARGMSEEPPDYHDDHEEHPMQKANKGTDPWAGYYDFIINEGSFKFWAAFQLVTALLLVYSAFAAAYYAKFNVITSDYDYYDDFFARSNSDSYSSTVHWPQLSMQTFQKIFDAISNKNKF